MHAPPGPDPKCLDWIKKKKEDISQVFFGDRRVSAALARRPPEGSAAQERCRLSSSPTDRARGGLGWVGWVSRALCPVPSRPARSAPRPRAFGSPAPPGGDQTQPLCPPNLTDLRPLHACRLRLRASSLRFPSRFTHRVGVAVAVRDDEEAGRPGARRDRPWVSDGFHCVSTLLAGKRHGKAGWVTHERGAGSVS
jgi:hypothetical protein